VSIEQFNLNEKKLIHFIGENYMLNDDELSQINPTTSLLEKGIIDSTGIMELVDYLEETYSIEIEPEEILPENLDGIKAISKFIESKLKVH